MKITAVLISRERDYPKEILDTLDFDEVLIETNCPSILRRYGLALKAKNDIIYVQDDDCLVNVELLKEKYNGQLTNFISEGHQKVYQGTGITLIGWGALFPKSMINFDKYIDKFGIDDLLLSQADRVFSYLNQPHNSIVTEINHLPRATGSERMYQQADHWNNLKLIQQQCEQLQ